MFSIIMASSNAMTSNVGQHFEQVQNEQALLANIFGTVCTGF